MQISWVCSVFNGPQVRVIAAALGFVRFPRTLGSFGFPPLRVRLVSARARVRLDFWCERLRRSPPRNPAPATELASARAERPFAAHDHPQIRGNRPSAYTIIGILANRFSRRLLRSLLKGSNWGRVVWGVPGRRGDRPEAPGWRRVASNRWWSDATTGHV